MKDHEKRILHIEKRVSKLGERIEQFITEQEMEFALKIENDGITARWVYKGHNKNIHDDLSFEVGDIINGLRCSLDSMVWYLSKDAIKRGEVKKREIMFPIYPDEKEWKSNAIKWLNEDIRQKIKSRQRTKSAEREKPGVDLVVINQLNNYHKHRVLITCTKRSAVGGYISLESMQLGHELGLRVGPDGSCTGGTIYGVEKIETGSIFAEGPIGELAIMGTVPSVLVGFDNDIDLDDEESKKAMAGRDVIEVLREAITNVKDTISVVMGEELKNEASDDEYQYDQLVKRQKRMQRIAKIYKEVPNEQTDRRGWCKHLK